MERTVQCELCRGGGRLTKEFCVTCGKWVTDWVGVERCECNDNQQNQSQSVEGLKEWFEANYLDGEKIQDGQMLSSKECFDALAHQQSAVLETVRKMIEKKKVTNDFAKRHPESYKYELGWDSALDDIISSLSNNKS